MSQNSGICLSYPNISVTLQDRPEFEYPLLDPSEKYDWLFLNEEAQVLFHCIKVKPKPSLPQSKVHKPIPLWSEVKVPVKHLKWKPGFAGKTGEKNKIILISSSEGAVRE